jgi:cytochrome c556
MRILSLLTTAGALCLHLFWTSAPAPSVSPSPAFSVSPTPDTVETKPLRLLMVGLAQDMDRINTGLWHEDFDLMRQGAAAIADHPKIPPEQMATIKMALENEAETFVQYDKTVHKTASELAEAAADDNLSRVLDAYTRLRDGCVGCHTAYRDRLRPVLAP